MRRSMASASAPPYRPKTISGTSCTAPIAPTAKAEPVNSLTCNGSAIRVRKLPKEVTAPAIQISRKSREERHGDRSGSSARTRPPDRGGRSPGVPPSSPAPASSAPPAGRGISATPPVWTASAGERSASATSGCSGWVTRGHRPPTSEHGQPNIDRPRTRPGRGRAAPCHRPPPQARSCLRDAASPSRASAPAARRGPYVRSVEKLRRADERQHHAHLAQRDDRGVHIRGEQPQGETHHGRRRSLDQVPARRSAAGARPSCAGSDRRSPRGLRHPFARRPAALRASRAGDSFAAPADLPRPVSDRAPGCSLHAVHARSRWASTPRSRP